MSINQRLRFRIFMRDGFTCQYCGLKAPATQLHVDHRLPRAKGGTDEETNLVTACITCNSGKSDMLIPITLTFQDGPLPGQTHQTTAHCPIIWVWRDTDGGHVLLVDEMLNSSPHREDARKVRHGPSWLAYPDDIPTNLPRLRFRESDGATSELIGAYAASDIYPFDIYPMMVWMEPWQLLCDFDFNDPRGE